MFGDVFFFLAWQHLVDDSHALYICLGKYSDCGFLTTIIMERSAGGGGVTTNNQVELFRELEDSQHSTTSNKSTNQWKRSDVLVDRSKPTTNNQLSANNTGKPRQLSLVLSSGQGDSMRKRSSVKSVRESELILAALMGATTNVNISGKGTKNGPFSITGRSATTPIGSGKSGLFSGLGWNGSGKVAVSADSHSNASVTAGPCLTTEENPYNNNNDIEATRQPHDNQGTYFPVNSDRFQSINNTLNTNTNAYYHYSIPTPMTTTTMAKTTTMKTARRTRTKTRARTLSQWTSKLSAIPCTCCGCSWG